MFRLIFSSLCVCGLAAVLAGCGNTKTYSSIDPATATERSRAGLELPPDLVSTSSDELLANQAQQDAEADEVLPEPEGLKVERNDEEGWVNVDAPANRVWRKLVAHWSALGVDLVVAEPKTGIMETDWVKPGKSEDENGGLTDDLLNRFLGTLVDSQTRLDKYTMRLEKLDESGTRIHVSHRGIKKIQTSEAGVARNAQWEWVETEEEPERVRRALSSIIYGLTDGQYENTSG